MHSRFIGLANLREFATKAAVVGIAENRVGIVVVFPMLAWVFAFVLGVLSGHTSMVRGAIARRVELRQWIQIGHNIPMTTTTRQTKTVTVQFIIPGDWNADEFMQELAGAYFDADSEAAEEVGFIVREVSETLTILDDLRASGATSEVTPEQLEEILP